ncbi:MAG TPA: DEAD/DEAH box helicase [Alphaproteobacteria bacterium]|jgi:ATP-dependent RNA helicase DeaD
MPFPVVDSALARALTDQGYAEPTPVQAAVLEPDTAGRDLLVSAQTGSGKTVAYGLAMAQTLLEDELVGPNAPAGDIAPLALIIAPTRELALQVHRELTWLYKHLNVRVASCVGGMDVRAEKRVLSGGVHIVVGTPGRLRDHLERGNFETAKLRVVVLDEADEMLDLGFREDLEFMLDMTPPERQTLLFSATIPREIASLAKRFQRDAKRVVTATDSTAHTDIEYRAVRIAPNETEHAVVNILRYYEARGAMIFCATREGVRHLYANLLERGFAAVALSGELSQSERSHALQALRDGRARVCVCTDVAARGIDLPDLGLVIHADLPQNRETLLHRSGRTGRAGKKGTCVILVPHTRRRRAEQLLGAANLRATWISPPSAEEIRTQDQERLVREITAAEEVTPDEQAAAQAILAQRSAEDIAVAFIRLHRSNLPAPEELLSGGDASTGLAGAPGASPRPERDRGDFADAPWFRMNVGRSSNADPRWLLPLICRRGHVTKREIGAIRILDKDTRFQIATHAAEKFLAAASRPDEKDEGIHFEATSDAPPPYVPGARDAEGDSRPPRAYGDKPRYERRERSDGDKKPYTPGAYKGGNNYGKGGDKPHAPQGAKPYVRRPRADVTVDAGPSRRFEPGDVPGEARPAPVAAPQAEKPYKPREDKKPYTPREDKKPYEPRGEKKPYAARGDKPYGDKKPYAKRGEGGFAPSGDKKPYVKRSADGYVARREPAAETPREPRAQLSLESKGEATGSKSRAGKPFQKSYAAKAPSAGYAGKKFGDKPFGEKKFGGKKFGKPPRKD